jgi:glucose-1-phosphate thymidylyltransferase
MKSIKQAIILAAGEGQRLRPFTTLRPKVMLPVANRPVLAYVVEALVKSGIREIVMVVGYRKEQVQDYFGDGTRFGAEVSYVTQPHQLGTGQAMATARASAADHFLVLPGDNFIEHSTISSIAHASSPSALVRRTSDQSRYGAIIAADGLVKAITEKPVESVSNFASTCIYLLDQTIFPALEHERDLPAAVQSLISSGFKMHIHETGGMWMDIVYPWDILSLNRAVLPNLEPVSSGTLESGCLISGKVTIGSRSLVRGNCYISGPAVIGQGCEIGPGVCIMPNVSIGDNVRIGPFSTISNSVICSNTAIGPYSHIQDSVIGFQSIIGSHLAIRTGEAMVSIEKETRKVSTGALVGDYCQIQDHVTIQPGVIISNRCLIKPLKVISEALAEGSLVA